MYKLIQFFREVRAELGKVVWPTRQETIRYTGLVILFAVIVAVILGGADLGFTKLLEKIINR